jgi:hypothetical protein
MSGIMWIGHLWYFNFTQTPTMPKIPAELRPAIPRYIMPEALWWFRWGAMSTIVFGILLALMNSYLGQAIVIGIGSHSRHIASIGIGMWLGTIMWAMCGSSSGRISRRCWAWWRQAPSRRHARPASRVSRPAPTRCSRSRWSIA